MREEVTAKHSRLSSRDGLMLAGGMLLALFALYIWTAWGRGAETSSEAAHETSAARGDGPSNQLTVSPDVVTAAGIESVPVSAGPAAERLQTTGVVEPDQQQIQDVTPLIAGRIERVSVTLGDYVQAGTTLLTVASPQIAELRGTLRSAQAKLVEADATFNRTKQLVELGAGAGKDLVAAEAAFRAAQAQVAQVQQSLRALGANIADADGPDAATAVVAIRAPMSGQVIARTVNAGAWIEAGKSLFTIANLNTVWVIANVPEARLSMVRVGAPVEIRAPTLGASPLAGRVNYVDPQLTAETRTAKVRVDVPNKSQALKVGMFVDVVVQGTPISGASELTVPSASVQRIGERTVVFVPTADRERFEVRDVELGDEVGDAQVVRSGLTAGDRVVTKGGFTLKSQLLKGQFGEDEEIAPKAPK